MENRKIKIVAILFILMILIILPLKVFAVPATVEDQRKAVISVAEAYQRKAHKVQYCSYRKDLFASPEDATEQKKVFTVCSGFTFQSYYQALGVKIPPFTANLLNYASANKDKTDNIIFFYEGSDIFAPEVLGSNKEADKEAFISKIIDKVLPGDVFVYTGHATLVKEVDKATNTITLLESSSGGYKFDPENRHEFYSETGTIREKNFKNALPSGMERMALIRFITDGTSFLNESNVIENYDGITEASSSRLEFPDIDIEKTVQINGKYGTNFANPGDILSFKIEIKNNSLANYSNIKISENIDSNLIFISSEGGVYEDKILEWENVTVNAGESKILNYQVKLSNDKKVLGETIISTGNVSKINSGNIEIKVGASLDNNQINQIKNSFNNFKTNTINERNFINQVYLDALGVDLDINGLSNFDIISYDSEIPFGGSDELSVRYTKVNPNFSNLILNNYYGLKLATATDPVKQQVRSIMSWNIYIKNNLTDRAREISSNILEEGDIILTYQGKETVTDSNLIDKSYIYLDDSLYRKLANNTIEQLSNDELENFLTNLLVENYVILRPALIYGNIQGETIDPDGGNPDNPDENENPDLDNGNPDNPDENENPDPDNGNPDNPDENENPDLDNGNPDNPDENENPDLDNGNPDNPDENENPDPDNGNPDNPDENENPDPDSGIPDNLDENKNSQPTPEDEAIVPLNKLPNAGKQITTLVLVVVFGIVAFIAYKKIKLYNF